MAETTKYHLSPNGQVGVCNAKEGNCPFGEHTPHGSKEFVEGMRERQEATRARYERRGVRRGRKKGPTTELSNLNNGTMSETFGNLNVLLGNPYATGDARVALNDVDFVRYETYDEDGVPCRKDIYNDGLVITKYDDGRGDDIKEYNVSQLDQSLKDSSAALHTMFASDRDYQSKQADLQVSLKRDLGMMAVWNKEEGRFELQDFDGAEDYSPSSNLGRRHYDRNDSNLKETLEKDLDVLTGYRITKEDAKTQMDKISKGIKDNLGMTGVLRSGAKGKNIVMGRLDEHGNESIMTCTNDSWVGGNPSILNASKASAFEVMVDPPEGMSREDVQKIINQTNQLSSASARRRMLENNGFRFSEEAVPANPVYGDSLKSIGERYGDNGTYSAMESLAVAATRGGLRQGKARGVSESEWGSAMHVYAVAGSEDFQPTTPYDMNGRMADLHSMVSIDEDGNYSDTNDVRHIVEKIDHDGYVNELRSNITISPSVSYETMTSNGEVKQNNLKCAMVGDRMVFPVCLQATVRNPDPGFHKSRTPAALEKREQKIAEAAEKAKMKELVKDHRNNVTGVGYIKKEDTPKYHDADSEWKTKGRVCPDCHEHLDDFGRCNVCAHSYTDRRLMTRAYKLGKKFKIFDFLVKDDDKNKK